MKRRRPGEWVVCNPIGVEPDLFKMPGLLKEGRWPTRHDLDRVAPDNPVYIEPAILAAPGHAFANTAALRLAGITRDTKAPDGVKIALDDKGEPTGHVEDYNFPKVIPDAYNSFRPDRALFPMVPVGDPGADRRGRAGRHEGLQRRRDHGDLRGARHPGRAAARLPRAVVRARADDPDVLRHLLPGAALRRRRGRARR